MLKIIVSFLSVFLPMEADAGESSDVSDQHFGVSPSRGMTVQMLGASGSVDFCVQADAFLNHKHQVTESDKTMHIKDTQIMLYTVVNVVQQKKNGSTFYSVVFDAIFRDVLCANGVNESASIRRHWRVWPPNEHCTESYEGLLIVDIAGCCQVTGIPFDVTFRSNGTTLYDVQGYRCAQRKERERDVSGPEDFKNTLISYYWQYDPSQDKPIAPPRRYRQV